MKELLIMAKEWSDFSVAFRLVSAVLAGSIVGFDRAMKRRGAGLKTHVLVCLGSALVMMTGQFIHMNYGGNMDVARLGAQVISGVGFLGVGTIIVTGRNQVRGLTTAAGLWACACVGIAIGIGFVFGAFLTLLLVVFSFNVLTKIDREVEKYAKTFDLYLEFATNKCITAFVGEMRDRGIKINNIEIGKSKIKGEGPNALISVEVRERKRRITILDELRELECVKYVEEL